MVLAPAFCKTKKIILIKRRGNSMTQKLMEMIQVTVGFILMDLFLFGFTKTKTGAKTAPQSPKLSYFDRRAPQLRGATPKNDLESIKQYFRS